MHVRSHVTGWSDLAFTELRSDERHSALDKNAERDSAHIRH